MRQVALGASGIQVGCIGLGTAQFGDWSATSPADSARVIHAALDGGINLIDTADAYSAGQAETIVGEAIAGCRDKVVLATKFGRSVGTGDLTRRGGSRRWIMQAVEDSLRRLKTDWIDLYQIHWRDDRTDLDETLGALSDLVHQGKVRAIGSSVFTPEWIVEAQWVSERRHRERLLTEQAPYSILARGAERSVLSTCNRHNVSVLVHQALNGGWLTGKYTHGAAVPAESRAAMWPYGRERFDFSRPEIHRKLEALASLDQLARHQSVTLAQLAIAFVVSHPAVDSTLVGARTQQQLLDLLPAGDLELDGDVLSAIDAIVPPATDLDPADYDVAYAVPHY